MTNKVQFGLCVPGDPLAKARRHHYMEDVNRLLNTVKGAYVSAWLIDHLQFQNAETLRFGRGLAQGDKFDRMLW